MSTETAVALEAAIAAAESEQRELVTQTSEVYSRFQALKQKQVRKAGELREMRERQREMRPEGPLAVDCPACGATAGGHCTDYMGNPVVRIHPGRIKAAEAAGAVAGGAH